MKKTPVFKSVDEERAFWDTHSVVDYLSDLEEAGDIEFSRPPLKRNFQMRLDDDTIRDLKKLAKAKGVDVSVMIRQWIREHLEKELKSA